MTYRPLRTLAAAAAVACSTLIGACSGESDASLLAAAKKSLASDETKGAVIQLKGALQQNPDMAEARFLLGQTLQSQGDSAAALVELRKAQQLNYDENKLVPELARAMLFGGEADRLFPQFGGVTLSDPQASADLGTTLATAYAARREFDKARSAIAAVLARSPDDARAKVLLAQVDAAVGDVDAALKGLDAVLAAKPDNIDAAVTKANLLLQVRNDRSGAMAIYQQVLVKHPDSVEAQNGILELLFREGRIDDARAAVAALKKVAPDRLETLLYEAQLAFSERRYKESREISARLLKLVPNNVRVLELAGATEFRLRQYLQAESMLSRALGVAPQQLLTRQMLAQTHLRSGQPDKAIQVLGPVLAASDADGASLALAGEAYLQMGDNARSEEVFKRALKAAPTNPTVRTSAALAQMATGRGSTAVTELESIVAGGGGPRANLALISGRLRQNDVPGALKAIDELQKQLPEEPLAAYLRGRILLAQNDIAGARRNFEAALSKEASYFPAIASLAAIEVQENKPEMAQQRFEALLRAQPQQYRAMLALAELGTRTGAPATQVLDQLRQAAKIDPTAVTPRLLLINRLLSTGDPRAAQLAAQDASAAIPSSFEIQDALGRSQLASGDAQRAISTFKDLTSQQPTNPQHELRLAEAYIGAKDNESAAAALKRALRVQPGLLPAKRGQVMLAMMDKRPQEALLIAREMQKSHPKDPAGFALEGEIEVARKNWDAAINAYRQVIQRSQVGDAPQRLHSALVAGGKRSEADRMATDWTKAHPKDISFQYYLGDLALAQGELKQAESQYRAVLAVQPKNALAMNNVAWLMARQGQPGAVAMAQQATELLPGKAPLLDTLSVALEADNQLGPAIDAQKRALVVAPGDPKMTLRLARLYLKQGDKPRARAELESLTGRGGRYAEQAEVEALLKTL